MYLGDWNSLYHEDLKRQIVNKQIFYQRNYGHANLRIFRLGVREQLKPIRNSHVDFSHHSILFIFSALTLGESFMYAFHVTVKRMYTGKSFLENAP
jgi:hypothetical protein